MFHVKTSASTVFILVVVVIAFIVTSIMIAQGFNRTTERMEQEQRQTNAAMRKKLDEAVALSTTNKSATSALVAELHVKDLRIEELERIIEQRPTISPVSARWAEGWEPPPVSEVEEDEIREVSGVMYHYLKLAPRRLLTRDGDARMEFATDIYHAGRQHEVPPKLLAIQFYREASYRTDALGLATEIGLAQVHGEAAKRCDLETRMGQMLCGAKWMRMLYEKCGDWLSTLIAYKCGSCKTNDPVAFTKMAKRVIEWRRLEDSPPVDPQFEEEDKLEPAQAEDSVERYLEEDPDGGHGI